jgi:hypothetical protein
VLILLVVVACAAAALYLVYALHRYGGRERALRRHAAAESLRYSDVDPAGISKLRLPSFASAHGVRVSNVLSTSDDGERARAFDFALWRERTDADDGDLLKSLSDEAFGFGPSTGGRTTRVHSAPRSGALVRVDAFLPLCTITPASWMTRAFESVGIADIDFESDEFNRGWDVRCADRRFASVFVDAQLIDLILTLDHEQRTRVGVETFGNYVLLTAGLVRPDRMVQMLRAAQRIPSLLSSVVVDEYPTAAALEARSSIDAWQTRPDGRGGNY